MKSRHFVKAVLLSFLCLVICPTSLCAEGIDRFEEGAERCFADYVAFTEEAMLAGEAAAKSELNELAEQSFRCFERYESKLPKMLAAKQGSIIDIKIKVLKGKIKKLKKKAKKQIIKDLGKGLAMYQKVAKLEAQLQKWKDKKKYGACTPGKTKINMIFENNSSDAIVVYIYNSQGQTTYLDGAVSGKIMTHTMTLQKLWSYIGDGGKKASFKIGTIKNGSPVSITATMNLKKRPKKKPCKATARFELFDNTFPTPQAKYYIFWVEAGNSPTYFIGTPLSVAKRTPCSFAGGGLDCTSKVKYHKLLSKSFSSLGAAQKAWCDNVNAHEYWQFSSCPNRYKWHGATWYWGCDGSITGAISKYCPNKFK